MKCGHANINTRLLHFFTGIGADILDSTNQNTFTFGRLKEENSWFELDHIQRKHFDSIQLFNGYLREEFHAIHHVLWTSGSNAIYGDLPERYDFWPFWRFLTESCMFGVLLPFGLLFGN